MWILGLKGLIWKRLFRALDKVSLLLKINLLIKLVLWSFFGPKKEWQITWAHPGLSLRGGGRGFPPATMNLAPGYFDKKIEENRTKRND